MLILIVPSFFKVTLASFPAPAVLSAYIPAEDFVFTFIIPLSKFSIVTGFVSLSDCPNIPIKPVRFDPAVPKSIVPLFWTVAFTLPNIPTEFALNTFISLLFTTLVSSSVAKIPTAFLFVGASTVIVPLFSKSALFLANTPVASFSLTLIFPSVSFTALELFKKSPIDFSLFKLIIFLFSTNKLPTVPVKFSALIATEGFAASPPLTFMLPSFVIVVTLSAKAPSLAKIPADDFAPVSRVIVPLLVPLAGIFALSTSIYIPAEPSFFTVISAPSSFVASVFLAYIAAEAFSSIVIFPIAVPSFLLVILDSSPYMAAEPSFFIVIFPVFSAVLLAST